MTSFDREISERPEPSAAEVDLSTGFDACVVEGLHAEQGASKFTVGCHALELLAESLSDLVAVEEVGEVWR